MVACDQLDDTALRSRRHMTGECLLKCQTDFLLACCAGMFRLKARQISCLLRV